MLLAQLVNFLWRSWPTERLHWSLSPRQKRQHRSTVILGCVKYLQELLASAAFVEVPAAMQTQLAEQCNALLADPTFSVLSGAYAELEAARENRLGIFA